MAALATQVVGTGLGLLGDIFGGQAQKHAIGTAANIRTGAYNDAMNAWGQNLGQSNQYLFNAAQNATQWAGDAANYGQQVTSDAARTAAGGVTDAASAAKAGMDTAVTGANQALDPYVQLGNGAVAKLSDLANNPNFSFNQDDPSYQWRLQQGQKSLENSAAGRAQTGAAAKAMTRYAQGAASTEYQAAFNRWLQSRQQQQSLLTDSARIGAGAATQTGANLMTGARYGGDITTDAAKYAGDMTYGAAKYGSDIGINAAQYGGNAQMRAGEGASQNQMTYGRTLNDLILGKADSRAAGVLGQGAAQAGMWTSLGKGALSLSDILKGFKWGGSGPGNGDYGGEVRP